ncbi:hypothetical protein BCR39DRAFT_551019 [Naematelia encephala]|uniref:DUF676 domain-containing protein n=1 Tax=Naematelia encephala TaxID=71784 RepID=A0A1Y2AJD6_9TREE|nr:hypothetical protein BCR39DRAFT_551019 [Naematelia encephala]
MNYPVIVYDVDSSQPDPDAVYFRGPWHKILWDDTVLILRSAREIPNIFLPLPTLGIRAGPGNLKDITNWGAIFQAIAILVSFIITIGGIFAFFLGVPMPFVAYAILVIFLQINVRIQGPETRVSRPADDEKAFKKEAWLFVNGIATSGSGVQLSVDFLREKFGRQVIGICNRTQGIWFDLVECMLQRDLLWPTQDVNLGYAILSAKIRDQNLKRVVLIAHSQGGIIASTWLDQLLADFPTSQLNKLEIYTFASASNHFSAPSDGSLSSPFGRIEHFANSRDFVADIGVLAFAPNENRAVMPPGGTVPKAGGRYAGRIFKRIGHTGHLLLSH